MATANPVKVQRFSWSGLLTSLAVVLFIALVVRFLSLGIPGVARHPPDKHWAYWLHIAGGSVVMALGPFQLIAPIRNRFRRYHRWAGYTFVGASIRVPASCNGVVGLKPSRGRISYGPDDVDIWFGSIYALCHTRSIRDTAAFLDATAGSLPGDPYNPPRPEKSWLSLLDERPKRHDN